MIAAVAVPAPFLTTIVAGRTTIQRLRVVRTCECGKNSLQADAARCSHSDCPLRFGRDLNRANDAAGSDCHHDESHDFSTVSQQNRQDVT
jgi:hypothetical protein